MQPSVYQIRKQHLTPTYLQQLGFTSELLIAVYQLSRQDGLFGSQLSDALAFGLASGPEFLHLIGDLLQL